MSVAAEPVVPEFMMAARLHAIGEPMRVDRIAVPEPRPTDVLVEVRACGIVPNLQRVIDNFFGTKTSDNKLYPPLPWIFGLDPAGVVASVGAQVTAVRPGERVYVNPARGCGSCRMCRAGRTLYCPEFSFQGYFARSRAIMLAYPYGGFAQYITAPVTALVRLPDRVSYNEAARLGYLGTVYSAMKKIGVGPGNVLLINGISGTLGLCAALIGLAMGAKRVLGTGRNPALLERVRALAPGRVFVHAMSGDVTAGVAGDPLSAFTAAMTDGMGVDGVIDCLPPGAPPQAMMRAIRTLRRGGKAVNVGAVAGNLPLDAFWMMTNQIGIEGSVWFTPAEGEEIVALADAGFLNLSVFEHRVAPLSGVDDTLAQMRTNTDGGFANYVIEPCRVA